MTECIKCADYLARRRRVLLPHLGLFVQRTGKPPAVLVKRLTDRFHKIHTAQDDR